jgi:hypothetical protein
LKTKIRYIVDNSYRIFNERMKVFRENDYPKLISDVELIDFPLNLIESGFLIHSTTSKNYNLIHSFICRRLELLISRNEKRDSAWGLLWLCHDTMSYIKRKQKFPFWNEKKKKNVNKKSVLSFFQGSLESIAWAFQWNSWSIFFWFKRSNPNCTFIVCKSYIFCKVILLKIWILVGLSTFSFI